MSFRRCRSRVGPRFQAIIPEMLAIERKEELQKVYEYDQSPFDIPAILMTLIPSL